MQDVFETVEPAQANLQTHGHKIRELLLLAAMEVEAPASGVLRGVSAKPGDELPVGTVIGWIATAAEVFDPAAARKPAPADAASAPARQAEPNTSAAAPARTIEPAAT